MDSFPTRIRHTRHILPVSGKGDYRNFLAFPVLALAVPISCAALLLAVFALACLLKVATHDPPVLGTSVGGDTPRLHLPDVVAFVTGGLPIYPLIFVEAIS